MNSFSQRNRETPSTVCRCRLQALSIVNTHVDIKVFFLCKTLSTLRADERPLSCVNTHVGFKVSSVRETLVTLLASERLHSSVNFHVPVQVFFLLKLLPHGWQAKGVTPA